MQLPRWCAGALAAFAAFCVIGDFFLFRTAAFNADYVQSFNELTAIGRGNVLLHGVSVASDSFYLTDLPFYLAGSLVMGKNPLLIYIVPYVVFLLFLAAGSVLAWQAGASPAQRACGAAAVLVVFAIPDGWPQSVFLVSDEHGAGIMISLVALVIAQGLLKTASPPPGRLVMFCGLVFIIMASDQLAFGYFVLPFFMLFGLRAWVYREASRAEILLLGFLFCVADLGALVPGFISRHGGFTIQQSFSLQFIPFVTTAFANARTVLDNLVYLFAARPDALGGGVVGWLVAASRLLMGLGLAGLCGRALWRLPLAKPDVITQWLAFGAVTLAMIETGSEFFALNSACNGAGPPVCGIRFVTPVYVYLAFAGILEGQRFFATAGSLRLRKFMIGGLAFAGLLVSGLGAERFIDAAGAPAFARNAPQVALGRWLAARQLSYGVSDYWTAQLLTALTGGRVKTDTVIVIDKILPGDWIGDEADLNAGRRPQFVVFNAGDDGFRAAGQHPLDVANITAAYGAPADIALVGGYQVAILKAR